MAMAFDLIPQGTLLNENGYTAAVEIGAGTTRTFYCVMEIVEQIEQESLDISIWGSADGENWGAQPILKLPQQFYRGETRAVLDLTFFSDVKFIRAGWELNRWGRGTPSPMFVLGLHLSEVPAMPTRVEPSAMNAV
jgi:hypothetical protein